MKVLIIDDHALFREGLRYLLRSMTDDLEYVEQTRTTTGFNARASGGGPYSLRPQYRWHRWIGRHRRLANPLAGNADRHRHRVGTARGYRTRDGRRRRHFIPKTVSSDAMVSALERVARGESYVPDLSKASGEAEKMVLRAPMTNRQMDIQRLLAIGKTNRQIGKHLDIAENTVRVHLSAIFKNLGVKTRTEVVFVAVRTVTIPV